jgi:hypothetical protein
VISLKKAGKIRSKPYDPFTLSHHLLVIYCYVIKDQTFNNLKEHRYIYSNFYRLESQTERKTWKLEYGNGMGKEGNK